MGSYIALSVYEHTKSTYKCYQILSLMASIDAWLIITSYGVFHRGKRIEVKGKKFLGVGDTYSKRISQGGMEQNMVVMLRDMGWEGEERSERREMYSKK